MDGQVYGNGIIALDKAALNHFHLNLEKINLANLWKTLYNKPAGLQGIISGNLEAQGQDVQLKNWQIAADLMLTQLVYKNQPLPDIKSRFNLNSGLTEFEFIQKNSKISIKSEIWENNIAGDISGEISTQIMQLK